MSYVFPSLLLFLFACDQICSCHFQVHGNNWLMFLIFLLSKDDQEKLPQTDETPLSVDDQVSGPSIFLFQVLTSAVE